MRAKKPCGHGQCPALVTRPDKFCPKHAAKAKEAVRAYDRERNQEEHRRIYRSARWLKLRGMKLRANPFCELADVCVKRTGHAAVATVVDHIKSTKEHPELAFTWENLRSACKACHDARTAREQGYGRKKHTDPAEQ